MESKEAKTTERKKLLDQWLSQVCGLNPTDLQAMPGDASFRRYFRLATPTHSYVVMDAPPPQENCQPFVAIAKQLRKMGIATPEIIQEDIAQGFLLITDFGDITYLSALNALNADQLYQRALRALALLQSCRDVPGRSIPPFTAEFMQQEWAWHKEWFLDKLLGMNFTQDEPALNQCFDKIVASAVAQPQVFMHRDYHSANLMLLPEEVGILDFQDAFIGPLTYDLVSLLRDCYIDWPQEKVTVWALDYFQKMQTLGVLQHVSAQEFLRWFDWMGLQRHLKALLTFARKYVRDHQAHYLNHIPRTLSYLIHVSQRYPEFSALYDFLTIKVKPTFEKMVLTCAR